MSIKQTLMFLAALVYLLVGHLLYCEGSEQTWEVVEVETGTEIRQEVVLEYRITSEDIKEAETLKKVNPQQGVIPLDQSKK